MVKKTDLSWIAGFVDGEGCVTINAKKNIRIPPCYVPVLAVSNTNLKILKTFLKILRPINGSLFLHRPQGQHHKESHRIQYVGQNCRDVLKLILPYLKLKKRVADLVLNFPKRRRSYGLQAPDWKACTKQAKALTVIRTLNQRGIK